MADTLFALLNFAQRFDIDLSEELKKKIKKNDAKYPIDKVKGKNNKYNEY